MLLSVPSGLSVGFAPAYSLSAAMIISILPIVLVYMLFQSRFQTNLLAGSVKDKGYEMNDRRFSTNGDRCFLHG